MVLGKVEFDKSVKMKKHKRSNYFILSLCAWYSLFTLCSCIKSLEDEGIYTSTICSGTIINNQNGNPVEGMRLSMTNGTAILSTTVSSGDGSFSVEVAPADLNHGYYLQAEADSLYGSTRVDLSRMQLGSQFFNLGVVQVEGPKVPTVETLPIDAIAANTAASGGNITSMGGSAVVRRGVCWSTLQLPTIADPHTTDGRGQGEYSSQMTGLSVNTVYYVRAYATNSIGTAYGEQFEFRTADGLPTVTTDTVTNISATTATSGGEVMADGGFTVTARGVCWSMAQQPTILNSHTTDSLGIGPFVSSLTGLEPATTYYVRAYATNASGTAYGEQRTFATGSGLPTIRTAAGTTAIVTATTITIGGSIDADGGFAVTARGVCYGTQPAPTIAGTHTTDGSGTGVFTSQITSLQSGITYYVRAYATNAVGTVYGEEVVFSTK